MAGDVEARIDAALHVQVLGDTAGDVGRPANVPVRVGEWCGEVDDVHAVGGGHLGQRDHAEVSSSSGRVQPSRSACQS